MELVAQFCRALTSVVVEVVGGGQWWMLGGDVKVVETVGRRPGKTERSSGRAGLLLLLLLLRRVLALGGSLGRSEGPGVRPEQGVWG